ncbi:hypothetical protein MIR68_003372 [Amoeboaphelidium protococcarum]|nr:hypothetical protein MIR68_003372 [Amoeboaphelidium protococcarum]
MVDIQQTVSLILLCICILTSILDLVDSIQRFDDQITMANKAIYADRCYHNGLVLLQLVFMYLYSKIATQRGNVSIILLLVLAYSQCYYFVTIYEYSAFQIVEIIAFTSYISAVFIHITIQKSLLTRIISGLPILQFVCSLIAYLYLSSTSLHHSYAVSSGFTEWFGYIDFVAAAVLLYSLFSLIFGGSLFAATLRIQSSRLRMAARSFVILSREIYLIMVMVYVVLKCEFMLKWMVNFFMSFNQHHLVVSLSIVYAGVAALCFLIRVTIASYALWLNGGHFQQYPSGGYQIIDEIVDSDSKVQRVTLSDSKSIHSTSSNAQIFREE